MLELLMKTNAFKVSSGNSPFWYTSGKIGPFYINTHYLFGSEESAKKLLSDIDSLKDDRESLIEMLEDRVKKQYEENGVYRKTIDTLVGLIKKNVDVDGISYVSGGERRDWFFSIMCAFLLNKKHIYLFKDNTSFPAVNGGKCLHVADLITEGSSYERSWIPVLEGMGIQMTDTVVCVNRNQGGNALLREKGVNVHSLVSVDGYMMRELYEKRLVDEKQYHMILEYIEDPDDSMKRFIKNNPDFLDKALNSDERTRQRALLCIEKGYYN
jgi:orotate phosphoribosyltransferase